MVSQRPNLGILAYRSALGILSNHDTVFEREESCIRQSAPDFASVPPPRVLAQGQREGFFVRLALRVQNRKVVGTRDSFCSGIPTISFIATAAYGLRKTPHPNLLPAKPGRRDWRRPSRERSSYFAPVTRRGSKNSPEDRGEETGGVRRANDLPILLPSRDADQKTLRKAGAKRLEASVARTIFLFCSRHATRIKKLPGKPG
jgi:hypothetical protein